MLSVRVQLRRRLGPFPLKREARFNLRLFHVLVCARQQRNSSVDPLAWVIPLRSVVTLKATLTSADFQRYFALCLVPRMLWRCGVERGSVNRAVKSQLFSHQPTDGSNEFEALPSGAKSWRAPSRHNKLEAGNRECVQVAVTPGLSSFDVRHGKERGVSGTVTTVRLLCHFTSLQSQFLDGPDLLFFS